MQKAERLFGLRVYRRREVVSTNDEAFALAEKGAPEGTAVVADTQSRGRGRHGRPWLSPPGVNLYASFVLRPSRGRGEWVDLPWVLAAAVAMALRDEKVGALAIKSPNDVLAKGKKIAGILLEIRQCGNRSTAVAAGMGINVNLFPGELPAEVAETAASIRAITGREVDRNALFENLCGHLDDMYLLWREKGPRAVRDRAAAAGIGFTGFADRTCP